MMMQEWDTMIPLSKTLKTAFAESMPVFPISRNFPKTTRVFPPIVNGK